MKNKSLFVLIVFCLCGCATTGKPVSPLNNVHASEKDLTAVASAVAGKPVSAQEMRNLEKNLRTNPEAQSAVKEVADSFNGEVKVKYCPVDGKRYAPNIQECPLHHVKLEWVK
ncbi:MAG: hypothetical protein HQL26_03215 [Candidatus Omnitrophica bacterium]|nr:hypothetical protein [Candidatus Omnitrophota bacterium]